MGSSLAGSETGGFAMHCPVLAVAAGRRRESVSPESVPIAGVYLQKNAAAFLGQDQQTFAAGRHEDHQLRETDAVDDATLGPASVTIALTAVAVAAAAFQNAAHPHWPPGFVAGSESTEEPPVASVAEFVFSFFFLCLRLVREGGQPNTNTTSQNPITNSQE